MIYYPCALELITQCSVKVIITRELSSESIASIQFVAFRICRKPDLELNIGWKSAQPDVHDPLLHVEGFFLMFALLWKLIF